MKILRLIKKIRYFIGWVMYAFPLKKEFGACADNVNLNYPLYITTPKTVYISENCRIQKGVSIINTSSQKVIIKRDTAITANVTIVPGNHTSTVGISQFLLGKSHVNDKSTNIVIEEDCWVGTRSILLKGTHLGRGCIVGAGAVVNKKIPPYAVVVGSPARIIAVKFSKEQIIEHEKLLYSKKERMTSSMIDELFSEYYNGLRVFGTSEGLGEKEMVLLEAAKQKSKYVEPY